MHANCVEDVYVGSHDFNEVVLRSQEYHSITRYVAYLLWEEFGSCSTLEAASGASRYFKARKLRLVRSRMQSLYDLATIMF